MRKEHLASKKKFGKLFCLVVTAAVLLGYSQSFKSVGAAPELFKEKIAPIFEQNCLSCHGAKLQRSGLDLRTEAAALKGGARGAAVVPGDPEKSLLYRLITHKEEPEMPMGGKLSDAEIAAVAEWIRQLQPMAVAASTEAAPVRAPGYSITDKDRQFWSFVKPVRPAVPAALNAKDRAWVKNRRFCAGQTAGERFETFACRRAARIAATRLFRFDRFAAFARRDGCISEEPVGESLSAGD